MTDQQIPDPDLVMRGEEPEPGGGAADNPRDIPGTEDVMDAQTAAELDSRDAERLDPLRDGEPDSYPGAAELNPDRWQEDPLLQDEATPVASDEPGPESDQTLWDETEQERYRDGEEQVPPEEPTIGEAEADVDFGEVLDADEADASNDSANFGGQFDPEDEDL